MTTKIKNIVKYVIPTTIFFIVLFIFLFVPNNGDPEFGEIGKADSMIIILIAIILLYLNYWNYCLGNKKNKFHFFICIIFGYSNSYFNTNNNWN